MNLNDYEVEGDNKKQWKCSCALSTMITIILFIQLALLVGVGIYFIKEKPLNGFEDNLAKMVSNMNVMVNAIQMMNSNMQILLEKTTSLLDVSAGIFNTSISMNSNMVSMIDLTKVMESNLVTMNFNLLNTSDLTAYLLMNLYELCVTVHEIEKEKCHAFNNTKTQAYYFLDNSNRINVIGK
eukprot:TRINITY_DN5790_c0_g1_i1.p1 TRINITY_DN5790_c0_g1~~TRINITY_DN5790_c0_g1_i1.p1  ORF type:complete len:182 (-),score=27.24 TRINITY_DN5790_c0_g1_i1:341-886(-)